jgi:hypothetical protein
MLKKKQENKSDCVDVFVAEDRKSLICEIRVQTSDTLHEGLAASNVYYNPVNITQYNLSTNTNPCLNCNSNFNLLY